MQQLSDPYRALGVARGATDAEIKAAHRKLAKRYHPDTGKKAETERFLSVQEAYRVLSDPLLRKEWDLKHEPGPVRATPDPPPTRASRRAAPKAKTAPPAGQRSSASPPRERAPGDGTDLRSRPRSSRAYTWSASEVPWWEEGVNRTDKRPPVKRKPREAERAAAANAQETPPDEPVFSSQQDFEVYNRSSGAAWSMAARAYFRKGDEDLPRRGTFHHQGTQVVTAGRARSVAQAEARRRAAAAAAAASAPPAGAASSPLGTAPDAAPPPRQGTTHFEQPLRQATPPRAQPRPQTGRDAHVHIVPSRIAPWPTIGQRLLYSLVGWIPLAALIALATTDRFGDAVASGLAAVVLGILVVVPRAAYVAAVAGVCVLLIGGLFVGALAISAGGLPAASGLQTALSAFIAVAYAATAAILLLGPASLRPWSAR